jgi:hypothetical protein
MSSLILKCASASRPSTIATCWVGRIMKAAAAPEGLPWMWTLAFGHHEDRTPTHGYAATREAMAARSHQFNLNTSLSKAFTASCVARVELAEYAACGSVPTQLSP